MPAAKSILIDGKDIKTVYLPRNFNFEFFGIPRIEEAERTLRNNVPENIADALEERDEAMIEAANDELLFDHSGRTQRLIHELDVYLQDTENSGNPEYGPPPMEEWFDDSTDNESIHPSIDLGDISSDELSCSTTDTIQRSPHRLFLLFR